MQSNPESPANQDQDHNREDPFSFEFYLNQSPEQKQEQSTTAHFPNREQHHHHHSYSSYSYPQPQSQSHSPSNSQYSSTSLSPNQDQQLSNVSSNDQGFTSSHHSYSSPMGEPYSTVPLSRSSSAHAFTSNSLGLQGDGISLEFNQNGRDGSGGSNGSGFGSVKMTHSESAPAFSFVNPQFDRRDSFLSTCSSSPSTSSTLSLANSYSSSFNGSNSINQQHFRRSNGANQNGGGSVSPASYMSHPSLSLPSPCPSPLGLPLSSISGLAIIDGSHGSHGSHGNGGSNSASSASSPQVNPLHHQQLLALSSDGENGERDANQHNLGMPLELNLGIGRMDHRSDYGAAEASGWNESWDYKQHPSPPSSRPTLGNALGLASSDSMDLDSQQEEEDQDGPSSKRRALPGANDIEEALPSPARSTAASKQGSSPAVRGTRPLGIVLKRRATTTSSNVDEITPVALSRPSFAGQSSKAASELARHRHSVSNVNSSSHQVGSHPPPHHHPQTPRSDSLPTNSLHSAVSSTPGIQTPASSHSLSDTPDYSTFSLSTPSSAMRRSGSLSSYSQHTDFESPVQSMMPPRLQRGQSYSGLTYGSSKSGDLTRASPNVDLPIGLPAHLQFGRNLERAINDGSSNEEHGLGIAGNGMTPLSPFRSPESRPSLNRNFSSSSVSLDPPRSAGYQSTSFGMSQLEAESPARMQRSHSLGMGAPHSVPSSAYSTSGSSECPSYSPSVNSTALPSGLGYPFNYGTSVPSTPDGPSHQYLPGSFYTAPASSGMKLTLGKGNHGRRKTQPPPLIVTSTGKDHACHCGKRFRRAEHLKRHQRGHTAEKPHMCPLRDCRKAFGRSDNLTQHLKTHFKHVVLSKEDLKKLMEDSRILLTSGISSRFADILESKEKYAALNNPHVPAKKRATKKRDKDGDFKEASDPKSTSKKNADQTQSPQSQSWAPNNENDDNSEPDSPNQRQALSPTNSAAANSPPNLLPSSSIQLYSH